MVSNEQARERIPEELVNALKNAQGKSEIQEALNLLKGKVERLEGAIYALINRLDPVLKPAVPAPKIGPLEGNAGDISPLRDEIGQVIQILNNFERDINSVMERLEI